MLSSEGFAKLVATWRSEAERFRTVEAKGQAATLELAAQELEQEIERWDSELLTLPEAAEASGYSEDHLRRLARDGTLPVQRNASPRSRIRVRRADLPVKPGRDGRNKHDPVDYDPGEDARSIAMLRRR
jgi:predicted DNA-binding transcriptional regulator AlpA